jgi:hypothetical protein
LSVQPLHTAARCASHWLDYNPVVVSTELREQLASAEDEKLICRLLVGGQYIAQSFHCA